MLLMQNGFALRNTILRFFYEKIIYLKNPENNV